MYAVDIRSMHTAIHHLLIARDEDDASRIDQIMNSMAHDNVADVDIDAYWNYLGELVIEDVEINFQDITDDRSYTSPDLGEIKIVNQSSYNIYM